MLYEYITHSERVNKWKYDIMFQEQYNSKEDASETLIRNTIVNMAIKDDAEGDAVFQKKDKDGVKIMKLSPSYFTATYVSLMKANKIKFNMRESDQVEMFWKCCFIYTI